MVDDDITVCESIERHDDTGPASDSNSGADHGLPETQAIPCQSRTPSGWDNHQDNERENQHDEKQESLYLNSGGQLRMERRSGLANSSGALSDKDAHHRHPTMVAQTSTASNSSRLHLAGKRKRQLSSDKSDETGAESDKENWPMPIKRARNSKPIEAITDQIDAILQDGTDQLKPQLRAVSIAIQINKAGEEVRELARVTPFLPRRKQMSETARRLENLVLMLCEEFR